MRVATNSTRFEPTNNVGTVPAFSGAFEESGGSFLGILLVFLSITIVYSSSPYGTTGIFFFFFFFLYTILFLFSHSALPLINTSAIR
jgi:hypothetical protein